MLEQRDLAAVNQADDGGVDHLSAIEVVTANSPDTGATPPPHPRDGPT